MHGTTGYGVGYAYKMDRDDNLAFTVGVGTAGGEQVGVASVGFEFGKSRSVDMSSYAAHTDTRRLAERLDEMERDLAHQKALWQEDASRCAADIEAANVSKDRAEKAFMECLQK